MKRISPWAAALAALVLAGCSDQAPVVSAPNSSDAGTDSTYQAPTATGEENLTPADLSKEKSWATNLNFQGRVLYSRGAPQAYRAGNGPLDMKTDSDIKNGDIISCPQGSELEISIHTSTLSDGVLRVGGGTWLVFEQGDTNLGPELQVRLYAGQCGFFLPPMAQGFLEVVTPAGILQNHGGIFSAAVSPLGQLLVIAREGQVAMTAPQETAALPGQVLVIDAPGGGRHYALKPDDALVFQERWLKVMSEEAVQAYTSQWGSRLQYWTNLQQLWTGWVSSPTSSGIKNLLLSLENETIWVSQALTLLPPTTANKPSPEALQGVLKSLSKIRDALAMDPWEPAQEFPGLMGAEP